MRVYNFSAGPSQLPIEVLEEAQRDLLDFNGSGMSVMELTHRGKWYQPIHMECIALVRELMNVPENYDILLVQGGASTQFEAVPLNLMSTGKADYACTGNFATKAFKEAKKFGDARCVASSEKEGYTFIPTQEELNLSDDADYFHMTSNNTIYGTKWGYVPKTNCPIVCDMSSNIMSEVINVADYGVIYAGAQKNLAPAGVTLVIIRKDLLERTNINHVCPTMLKYATQANNDSLYNTPPTFAIYMMCLNLRHMKALGGIPAYEKANKAKAELLYNFLDNSEFFSNNVRKDSRSIMNVRFNTPSEELDAKCISEAEKSGLVSLKGHRVTKGLRASIYNAMSIEGVQALVDFLAKFEAENK